MELNTAFGQALRISRQAAGRTQEDFTRISSRTYISQLERGLKSPTLEKLDELSKLLGMHPVTLVAATYILKNQVGADDLQSTLVAELKQLGF
ncbi:MULTISPECIES: helix-turn-helix domain-containing protein [Stutzerimonas]|jgi:transcriptional regulator with XRE-family HTH domain|uniref:Helix-turn-helix protein n=1 Tax=Stutzerimonas stutzeri TaxID=316 RepID=A0A5S5BJL6_STUST|nr:MULTISPECIES: helix-turn-helix transcriptional regulator [Stutzerimonas]AZZ45373.1 transcriptional regulator [Pseudomonadaceae bacterium SI-3]MBK57314.1 transcriptional regulator [Pseudomonas sp.]MCK5921982.1 helix-turn-helix transcriptional regulator [Methylococcales bacterium]MBK3845430.1 helix-turn-helix domain-containing protein [Stutzerimonas xanthomarina]MBK3846133.1 helix-turn-helix domain-containing protein [Stutzerimonas xanthomarina]|tara:strand:- start:3665 stop:3943 length:279 start_codon:yes stop_codon:yes gene_type:complete